MVLINAPYEPLYVRTADGESSIPRRVFYDVCTAYLPYQSTVIATFVRLFTTFGVIAVVFLLIIKFQVFDEFSEVCKYLLYIFFQSVKRGLQTFQWQINPSDLGKGGVTIRENFQKISPGHRILVIFEC